MKPCLWRSVPWDVCAVSKRCERCRCTRNGVHQIFLFLDSFSCYLWCFGGMMFLRAECIRRLWTLNCSVSGEFDGTLAVCQILLFCNRRRTNGTLIQVFSVDSKKYKSLYWFFRNLYCIFDFGFSDHGGKIKQNQQMIQMCLCGVLNDCFYVRPRDGSKAVLPLHFTM